MKRLALLWGLGVLVCTPMSAFATSYSFQTVISPAGTNITQLLADFHIEGAGSDFAAPATGLQPRLCDQV